jgi:hypothetical protein
MKSMACERVSGVPDMYRENPPRLRSAVEQSRCALGKVADHDFWWPISAVSASTISDRRRSAVRLIIRPWHGPSLNMDDPQMLESTPAQSSLLSKMREYLSTATAPQRIENIADQLGAIWSNLDKADRRIMVGMPATCGWKRGKWPHWLPPAQVRQPDAAA